MGGADQWGNITAGLELIRRTSGTGEGSEPAHGLAYKLLLSPSGSKFGKSEGGESVWLDAARTSPFAFYQYWRNIDDRDVGTYLRWFTEFPREQIEALEAETEAHPEARAAQLALALDITDADAWRRSCTRAPSPTPRSHSRADGSDDPAVLASLFASSGGFEFDPAWLASGIAVLLAEAGVFASRGEARRMIAAGGVTVNGERVTDPDAPSRADRRRMARRADRQAAARDRTGQAELDGLAADAGSDGARAASR